METWTEISNNRYKETRKENEGTRRYPGAFDPPCGRHLRLQESMKVDVIHALVHRAVDVLALVHVLVHVLRET
jgi:hypothetical protein